MTNKEIADRLRNHVTDHIDAVKLANELDPPKPEPGAVVWWSRWDGPWTIGIMHMDGSDIIVRDDGSHVYIDEIEWKPARICAPGEMPVNVPPPVSEWPQYAEELYAMYDENDGEPFTIITRDEAKRMEAER